MIRNKWCVLVVLAFFVCLLPLTTAGAAGNKANEIKKADHFLKKFEKNAKRAGGKPFPLRYDDKEALKRVKVLKQKYPDDPDVEKLFQRARACAKASEGGFKDITPEMLAYRDNEKKIAAKLKAVNEAAWEDFITRAKAEGGLVEKVFPSPDPQKANPEEIVGKTIILEDFAYPRNEFMDIGGQYVFVGSQTKGYYYVELSTRAWLGVYEALKRYRRQVANVEQEPWTLAGKVVGAAILVPQAGEEKTMAPWLGWRVEPQALWVPGVVFTSVKPESELGGAFAGEDKLEEIKSAFYTVKSVPDDVKPMDLVTIFATAIKERNYKLYLDCIDPARQKTPKALHRLRYFYDNNLERYRRFYVYVEPIEVASIQAIRGALANEGSLKEFFLDDADKEKIKKHGGEKVEEAVVMIRTFDKNGKQSAFPKKVVLRRYGGEGARWYIASGYPL